MEKTRCPWAGTDPLYIDYHDNEWGVPVYDDNKLFEFLIFETFQAGLSWITILRKRENFKLAFDNFDCKKIASYGEKKVEQLIGNKDIIRNNLKIRATISNARAYIKIQEEFGSFSKYIWSFTNGKPITNHFQTMNEVPAKTELSDIISKD